MLLQELISNFTTTNINFKTLAKSYFELASSKSKNWMRRMDLAIDATTVEDVEELERLIAAEYSDIIDTALPLEDGSAISLSEYIHALANEDVDQEEYMLYDKLNQPHSVNEVTEYISDQGVNLTAQICAFQAIMDAEVDEATGEANVQFSNYYNLVQSQLGEMSPRGKSIVNYYYNILSDSTVDTTTKLQLMLSPIQDSVTNYNEGDETLNVEFFVPQNTYTGISSYAAWCVGNNISWNSAWNVIKSGFKVIGTVIAGLWNGIKAIANKIFGYVTKPFTSDTGNLKQRSKYTTNFIDLPVAQGKVSLDVLFSTPLSQYSDRSINTLCSEQGIDATIAKQYINDKINSQSITSIDFTSFRILLWQDTDESDVVSFIVNVSPIATGSVYANPKAMVSIDNDYFVGRGINEALNEFRADVVGEDLDLNNAADTFKGLLASLNNIALVTGASILTSTDLSNPVCELTAEDPMSSAQYQDFRRISSFIGGYETYEYGSGSQGTRTYGYPNQFVDHGTNGDWSKADGNGSITNADIARIVCGSYHSIIEDDDSSSYARRGRGIIAAMCWLFIRQHFSPIIEDQSIYIPYTHIYSLGTPRFIVKGDPSGAAFAVWLTVAAIMAVTIVSVGASILTKRRKRRKLTKWQAVQWKATDTMANNPVGSAAYKAAQKQLVKANKKISRIESFFEITGPASAAGLASGIDLTGSSTDAIVELIKG